MKTQVNFRVVSLKFILTFDKTLAHFETCTSQIGIRDMNNKKTIVFLKSFVQFFNLICRVNVGRSIHEPVRLNKETSMHYKW